jgi:hypothetical protein
MRSRPIPAVRQEPLASAYSPQPGNARTLRSAAGVTTAEYVVMAGVLVAILLMVFQVFATQMRSAADRVGNCVAGAAGGADCSAGSGGFLDDARRGARAVASTTSQYWNAARRGVRTVANTASQYRNAARRGIQTVANAATRYRNAANRGVQAVTNTASRYWNAVRNAVGGVGSG